METGLRQSGGQRAICACQDLLPGPTGDGPDLPPDPKHEVVRGRARAAAAKGQAGRRKLRATSENNPMSLSDRPVFGSGPGRLQGIPAGAASPRAA